MAVPRITIAGATSGVGKTLITCGVIRALRKRGLSVQPFKVGPDYIDPLYLSAISGKKAYNLDVWLMGQAGVISSFVSRSDSDVSVIEGVMGFYDGLDANSNRASTHHVASITKSPVILVLDAGKTGRSIAATATGFARFHRNSRIRGVILNRIGSRNHEYMCRQALQGTGLPVVGVIPRDPGLDVGSRHLGLKSTDEGQIKRTVRMASELVSRRLDVDSIVRMLKREPLPRGSPRPKPKRPAATVAVAMDDSFNFYYPDNLAALQREGAKIKFFSPVRDSKIPRCDGMYIGGGFPEVLAPDLAKNGKMKKEIRRLAEDGMPLYAECGGLMYLTQSITDSSKRYGMVGLFDAETVMSDMTLHYTEGEISDSVISDRLHGMRGHEFHYSKLESVPSDSEFAYELTRGVGILDGKDGLVQDSTLASYGHLYFDSSDYAKIFVKNCARHSRT